MHFIQMQDFPTYTVDIPSYKTYHFWKIRPGLDWLAAQLADKAGKPVVINWHQIEIYV